VKAYSKLLTKMLLLLMDLNMTRREPARKKEIDKGKKNRQIITDKPAKTRSVKYMQARINSTMHERPAHVLVV
jgi:hypothetical protein